MAYDGRVWRFICGSWRTLHRRVPRCTRIVQATRRYYCCIPHTRKRQQAISMAILPHGFRIVKSSCSVAKMSKPRSTTIINLDGVENAILRTQLHSNLIVVAAMGLYRNQPVEYDIRMTGGYRQALVGGGSLPDWVEAGSMPRKQGSSMCYIRSMANCPPISTSSRLPGFTYCKNIMFPTHQIWTEGLPLCYKRLISGGDSTQPIYILAFTAQSRTLI